MTATPKEAAKLAKQARQAEKKGDPVKAYLLYSQAAAADPKRTDLWVRSQALRTRALQQSSSLPASLQQPAPPQSVPSEQPSLPVPSDEDKAEARRAMPPPILEPKPGKLNFDIRGDGKSLFEQVLKAWGLDQVFDADYTPGTPFRFQLEDVDFQTSLRALQAATSSFVVPLGPKLGMVFKDTQQKRNEAEPMVAVALSLPNTVTVQEAQELGRAVQQVLEMRRVAIDNSSRTVLLRDTVSKVRIAQKLYSQLLTLKSQVMVEIEILDVQNHRELNYGAGLPNSTSLTLLNASRSLSALARFSTGSTALAIANASLFANFTRSNSQSLFRALLRSVDLQAATLHVGDKYPLITSQYINSGSASPLAVPPTFNFEDLGLSLKITPRIHSAEEVSLQVEAEFKLLGSGSYNGIPVISNRKFASVARLRNGEWGVLSGLLSQTEARSISGIPGLGQIPILSAVLNQNTRSQDDGQVLVVLKPHILDAPPLESATPALYTGSEGRWNAIP